MLCRIIAASVLCLCLLTVPAMQAFGQARPPSTTPPGPVRTSSLNQVLRCSWHLRWAEL